MVEEIACWVTIETDVVRAEIPTTINELWALYETEFGNAPLALLDIAQREKRDIKYSYIHESEGK